ncbi:MAG: MFS transporter [Acutalibacteraceae bacterium]|nr:MFS transporter [Acutalibacteraceae bacterium]
MENRETVSTISAEPRRYVGKKETLAYVLNDVAASLNIDDYKERYIYDVIKIDFNYLAIQNVVATVWDSFNDTFIGVMVDKTRTRWGKFKPYVLLGEIPLTILGLWYWLIPFIFPNTPATYLPKWIFYFAMSIITETAGTFTSIAKTGFLSTITPEPLERSRLIALANVSSHLVEDLPKQAFGIIYDLIANKKLNLPLPKLFSSFGIVCAAASAAFALFFITNSRERVTQSIKQPSVKHCLKAVINNKPMRIQLLSSLLSGFSIGKSRTNFYIDVIGSITWKTIVGIPAFPIKFISYSFVEPLRRRFSTKTLWILEDAWTDMLWMLVFGIGSINKNFMKKPIILPMMAIEEIFEMCVYGLRRVIPAEIQNEALDYCEWKNGYRSEAMLGVTQSLITKIQQAIMGGVTNIVMGKIGYIQGLEIGTQTDKTKWWIFALGTGIPIITSSLGIIPKLFYPLSAETREKMYADLQERRASMAEFMKTATKEEIDAIAEKQLQGQFE